MQKTRSQMVIPVSGLAAVMTMAESVLKPLLGQQKGILSKLEKGDNAISFFFEHLPAKFKPKGGKVLTAVATTPQFVGLEQSCFYIVDINGHLVRLTTVRDELGVEMQAFGAIYTGNDKEGALHQAMQSAQKLQH